MSAIIQRPKNNYSGEEKQNSAHPVHMSQTMMPTPSLKASVSHVTLPSVNDSISVEDISGLRLGDPRVTQILQTWLEKPQRQYIQATASWVLSNLSDPLDAPVPVQFHNESPQDEVLRSLLLAARLLANRTDNTIGHKALAVLSVYKDERVARIASTALAAAAAVDSKALVPYALIMLQGGNHDIEKRALRLLSRSNDASVIIAIIEASEQSEKPQWLVKEYVSALRALTQKKLGNTTEAWRHWWNSRNEAAHSA